MPNKSGVNGKVVIGASDLADVRNWSFSWTSNNPQFSHSGAAGHKVSVAGVKSGSGSASLVLETDDAIYDTIKPGDQVTLLLHEDATRKWTVPCRIESMSEEVDIDDGGEETVSFDFTTHGAWTYPDGTVSASA